jgi:hypothetical protein
MLLFEQVKKAGPFCGDVASGFVFIPLSFGVNFLSQPGASLVSVCAENGRFLSFITQIVLCRCAFLLRLPPPDTLVVLLLYYL